MDFSSLTIQLNFLPFGRKMFAFAVWKYCTFQRKRVAIRWALHLLNTSVPTLSVWYPEMGLLEARAACSHQPSQGILKLLSTPLPLSPCLRHCPWDVTVQGLLLHIWLRAHSAPVEGHSRHTQLLSQMVLGHISPPWNLSVKWLLARTSSILAFQAFGWFSSVFLQYDMPALWTS